eukprot:s418_g37.t1
MNNLERSADYEAAWLKPLLFEGGPSVNFSLPCESNRPIRRRVGGAVTMADQSTLKALRNKLSDLEDELDTAHEAQAELEKQLGQLKSDLEAKEEKLQSALTEAKEASERCASSEARLQQLKEAQEAAPAASASAPQDSDQSEEVARLQAELQELQRSLKTSQMETKKLEDELKTAERQQKEAVQQEMQRAEGLRSEIQQLQRSQQQTAQAEAQKLKAVEAEYRTEPGGPTFSWLNRLRMIRSTDGRSGSERERGQEATSSRSTKGTKKDGKEPPAKKPSGPFSRCRFMDEDLRLCGDQVDPLLLESERDFLVVASLGAQKVGRSTVLSTLLSPFFHENGSSSAHFKVPLGIHSAETFLEGGQSYAGVDLCVTMDRLVLLDAPALFESVPAHPLSDAKSELYLMIFLASICHCILVVTDTAVDFRNLFESN